MNRALWIKAIDDAWRQLLASGLILLGFSWLFVWLMSHFPLGSWTMLLNLLPDAVQPLINIPLARLATSLGQLSIVYVHLVTLLVCVAWALGRGSDSISGEISRGTMDLIVALPIWRVSVVIVPAVVAAIGSAVLVACVSAGVALGLHFVKFVEPVHVAQFLPGAVNLFCLTFCLTAMATMVSSFHRDRYWAIGITGGFFVLSMIVKMISRLWPGTWLEYTSFLTAFQPQELILMPDKLGHAGACYDLTLLGLGLACYVVGSIVFSLRDIPGPR